MQGSLSHRFLSNVSVFWYIYTILQAADVFCLFFFFFLMGNNKRIRFNNYFTVRDQNFSFTFSLKLQSLRVFCLTHPECHYKKLSSLSQET